MPIETLRRTPFYNLHRELGGRFVPFHGWELPVQFSSILKEHAAVRSTCGIFDVSHMGQFIIDGPDALKLLQKVNSNDVSKLEPGRCLYSHLLNERGGVVDDVIVTRLSEARHLIVVNAGTIEKDFAWIARHAEGLDVRLENRSDQYAMLALQGPRAAMVIEKFSEDGAALARFGSVEVNLYGHEIFITRTGYTGENGYEIISPVEIASRVWRTLFAHGGSFGLLPCGLGARDTLRLEAGFLLYGSDIDDEHTPLEAGHGWVVKFAKGDFIGKEALLKQKEEGLKRRLYGVKLTERGVPRPGASVSVEGARLGTMSSATFSPTLKTGIGVAYLERIDLSVGAPVSVTLQGRTVRGEITGMPFYRRPASAKI